MKCRNPYIKGAAAYPCGQCMPCRFNRRREWTHRIMLEATQHSDSSFVTLTYSNENLRTSNGASVPLSEVTDLLPSLQPKDLQDWLKRLRTAIAPLRIRYYAVGEYGDETQRPHYHAAIFGFPSCRQTQTQYRNGIIRCCDQCELVRKTWGLGNIYLGTLATESAQYICGYVTKKMTAKHDDRLHGRHPEFARMSLRPGIGQSAMHEVASTLMQFNLEETEGDVPSALRHGKRLMPLGRYLRKSLRRMVGKDEKAPQSTLDAQAERLRPMYEASRAAPIPEARDIAFKNNILNAADQAVANMENRQRIFKKRKSL